MLLGDGIQCVLSARRDGSSTDVEKRTLSVLNQIKGSTDVLFVVLRWMDKTAGNNAAGSTGT